MSAVYAEKQEIKATALALDLPPHKVKKLLITHGDIRYTETDQIRDANAIRQRYRHTGTVTDRLRAFADSHGISLATLYRFCGKPSFKGLSLLYLDPVYHHFREATSENMGK